MPMNSEALLRTLRESVRKEVGDELKIAVAYSGGLDSSILAAIAGESGSVKCYACAVDRSFDALNALRRADEEGLKLRMIPFTGDMLARYILNASQALGTTDPMPISYTIPIMAVIEESDEKLVLAGNGADELFGGYSKYVGISNPEEMMSSDYRKMIAEANTLTRWAETKGKRLTFPFADEDVRSLSESLPLAQKIAGDQRKIVLREIAKTLNLPSHDRPKKAAQYSSGILRLMEGTAKREGLRTDEWTRRTADRLSRSSYQ
jgi:asparagine synthase (glutamine-hydrolysing)